MSPPEEADDVAGADEPAPRSVHLQAHASDQAAVYQAGRDQHFHYGDGARRRTTPGEVVDECPYPGLAGFGPDQARWFFGRDRLIADLIARLDRRLSAGGVQMVVAPSGAGKSSLLHAGLLPRLSESALPGSRRWPRLALTPTAAPLRALAGRLAALTGADPDEVAATLAADPQAGATLLRAALDATAGEDPGARVVVVVDQFEELFTLCTDEAERRTFVDVLTCLAAVPADAVPAGTGPPALVVAGLRADAYPACVDHPALRRALQDDQLLVGAMERDELREAIVHPAQDVGLELEPGLVEVLLRDLGAATDADGADGPGYEAGRLPLLAHALRACWQQRNGATLTVAGYQTTGGIQRAIAQTAEHVMDGLDTAGQDMARTVFLRLVKIGDGSDDTRRHLSRAALVDAAAPATAASVVDAFTRARLLTQDRDTVEITHDALLRGWPRLRRWIDDDRAGRLTHQDLEETAADWDRRERDTSLLYRGSRLERARAWAATAAHHDLSPAARSFLKASVRLRRRGARLRTGIIAVLTALGLVASGAGVVAVQQRRTADEQQRVATARQLLAKADAALESDPVTALRLNVAAHRVHPDAETYAALQQAITTTPYAGQLTGVDSPVVSVAYAPSGRYLAAGFTSGAAMLWDLHDPLRPRPLGRPLPGSESPVRVAFASGDTRLVTASSNGAVAIWDLTDPEHPRQMGDRLNGEKDAEGRHAWLSSDGTVLATSGKKKSQLQLWDLADPARIRRFGPALDAHPTGVGAVTFTADGTMMATSGEAHTDQVKLWDVRRRERPRLLGRIKPDPADVVDSLSFSGDRKVLAVGGSSRGTALWQVSDPARPRPARDLIRVDWFSEAVFAPQGTTLATTGGRGTGLLLWDAGDLDSPEQIERLVAGENDRTLAFSPDGRMVASGSERGRVTLWNLRRAGRPGAFGPPFVGHTKKLQNDVYALAMSRDAGMLATGGEDGTVALWETADPARPRRLGTLTGHGTLTGQGANGVNAVEFAPEGEVLATGDAKGSVSLWDLADRHRPRRSGPPLTTGIGVVRELVFAAGGGTLIVGGDSATQFWDVRDPARPRRVAQVLDGQGVLGMWRVRDGRVLALVRGLRAPIRGPEDAKGARLWDITDPGSPRQLGQGLTGHEDAVRSAAMSPSGNLLITGSGDGAAILWDVKDPGKARRLGDPLVPHSLNSAMHMAFAPTTDLMVTGGIEGDAYLWDLGNRILPRRLGTALDDNVDAVLHVAFSADGRILATAGSEGDVVLWNLRPTYELRRRLGETTCLVTGGGLNREQWTRYLPALDYQDVCAR
ncbi:hypothetical protein [Actinomadura sp. 9N215]|uniref:nSTAND1 domain-containing NTPase n=1 Tax=Actinomadura sp. 9N215 TaxID=3375150 RepID=UPI0037A7EBCA